MKNIIIPFAKTISKGLIIISLFALSACEKEENSSPPTSVDSNVTLLTHPQDPLILKIDKESEGEGVIEYYGKRGNDGLPIKIDQIRQLKNNEESVII